MVKLLGAFSRLKPTKVMLLGDLMLDTYTSGRVERISPEAPVPILHVKGSEDLPGGAGNVALNLKALGAEVICVGRIGDDKEGLRLKTLFEQEEIATDGIFVQKGIHTPLKNRLIAEGQQLIRVDQECCTPLSTEVEQEVLSYIKEAIRQVEVVAISDYAKGFLSLSLLKEVIALAKKEGIPILVDPKGDDFTKYFGATLIKPNFKEAVSAAKVSQASPLDLIGESLLNETGAEMIMVTRSEEGITLFHQDQKRLDFPVKSKEVKDVTGAGDTVLAMVAMSMGSNLPLSEGIHLSNVAASLAIERLGCVRVSLSDLAERLLEINVENKIFQEDHLFALEQALFNKKLTILGINSDDGVTNALFSHLQKLSKKSPDERLMIYLSSANEGLLSLLSSLHEVDFIVLQSDSLSHLIEKIGPKQVFTLSPEGVLQKKSHEELISL